MANPPQTLKSKVAIVTGATRGIGAALALDLAKRGANVVITYVSDSSASKAEDLVAQISSLPNDAQAIHVRADASDETSPAAIVEAATKAFGNNIDILINNAAFEKDVPLSEITKADFDKTYHVNVLHPLLLSKACLPHLNHPARIINISSVGARAGFARLSLYASSKAALEGITRTLAAELGEFGTTVNAVAPGPIESDMLAQIPDEIKNPQRNSTPVQKRFGELQEVASVVSFLADPSSSWVSGQVLNASGGWSMY